MISICDFLNVYSVIACVIGAIGFLWFRIRSARNYWHRLNVKSVEPVPLFGNTAKAHFQKSPIQDVYEEVYNALQDEPFGGIYEFLQPQLFVKDPQLVSAILVKDFKHFYDRGVKLILNENKKVDPFASHLFFMTGERWKLMRSKMRSVFSPAKMKLMHDQIMACVSQLTKYIDGQMDEKESLDVGAKDLFEKLFINVIGCCAFGIECNSFFKSNEKFCSMCGEALKPRLILAVRMLLATFSQYLANLVCPTIQRKEVHDFYVNLSLDTVAQRRQSGLVRNDLLQLLMELQNSHVDPKVAVAQPDKEVPKNEEFDELDIAANSFLFFVAGFETTASTLSFCLYELALNQDVQEKLRSEVSKIKEEQSLTYEMLNEMTYMDAVINETLRKYPPVTQLNRECTEDYVIPGTNTKISVGTEVVIPVWSIQHDCKNYPNPEVFDPERFVGENKYKRPSGIFLPFGDGPRNCLGKRFGDMEIKVTLSEMILRYDIKPCARTEIPLKFKNGNRLLHTTCGTWVSLVRRKY